MRCCSWLLAGRGRVELDRLTAIRGIRGFVMSEVKRPLYSYGYGSISLRCLQRLMPISPADEGVRGTARRIRHDGVVRDLAQSWPELELT